MEKLIDGQIYHWRWKDDARHADSAPYRSYHCKSQIAVVSRGGVLIDTFWSPGAGLEYAIHPEDVILTLMCDESWPTIGDGEIAYYDRADVIDTRHSNNSRAPIYLRPGATRDSENILQEIGYREEKARSDIQWAERQLERMAEARLLVGQGRLGEVLF